MRNINESIKRQYEESLEYARVEIKKAYKNLMTGAIEREEFDMINGAFTVMIEECKKQLGDEYQAPSVESMKKSVSKTNIDTRENLEEELATLRRELAELCAKRIAEGTGAYNESIRSTNEDIRELEEKLGLIGETSILMAVAEEAVEEAIEASESVEAVEEDVLALDETEELIEKHMDFTETLEVLASLDEEFEMEEHPKHRVIRVKAVAPRAKKVETIKKLERIIRERLR